MTEITVTFDTTDDYPEHTKIDFPITVQVGELLFEDAGGNLHNMTEEDKQEMGQFIRKEATADEAIEEALSVIGCAPAYDHVPRSEVDAPGIEATVTLGAFSR